MTGENTEGMTMAGGLPVNQSVAVRWADVIGPEATLVQRCAAGDEDASALLVAEHHRMVFSLASHLIRNRIEALDLTQEVFLQVFRTIHQFRGQSALRTWINRITVNQARNRLRLWRRRCQNNQVSLDAHLRQSGDLALCTDATPERVFARDELAGRLRAAIDRLPFEQRTAIVLRELEGLSYQEIAASLGVAIGTVKSRLTRARQALRAELRAFR